MPMFRRQLSFRLPAARKIAGYDTNSPVHRRAVVSSVTADVVAFHAQHEFSNGEAIQTGRADISNANLPFCADLIGHEQVERWAVRPNADLVKIGEPSDIL